MMTSCSTASTINYLAPYSESGRLAEEVTDCGPVIDLKATPGCQLQPDASDRKAEFPACCPVYDCEEGTEVNYVNPPKTKKKENEEE